MLHIVVVIAGFLMNKNLANTCRCGLFTVVNCRTQDFYATESDLFTHCGDIYVNNDMVTFCQKSS